MFSTIACLLLIVSRVPLSTADNDDENGNQSIELPDGFLRECCESGQVVNKTVRCVDSVNGTVSRVSINGTNGAFPRAEVGEENEEDWNEQQATLYCNETCVDIFKNITRTFPEDIQPCKDNNPVDDISRKENVTRRCRSILVPLQFWGANMVVFANVIYIIPYTIVFFVYLLVPELRKRAYDGAVIFYNASQMLENAILIAIGYTLLCNGRIDPAYLVPSGLVIMFLTISSTFWLFVICIDVTLVITRFRWAPPSDETRSQEVKKLRMYALWVWGLTSFATLIACILEIGLPESSSIRPNFRNFNNGPNISVIVYVATLPAVVCIANTVLFVYTTYKVIAMKKSTAFANQSASKKAKKCYSVYFKLYLLMDTPWLTGALGAIFSELWLLKFFRMLQPILMLLVILPRKTIMKALKCAKDADG